jgi:hypothetical protein
MMLLRNIGIDWKKSLISQLCDGETRKGLGNGVAHQWFGAIQNGFYNRENDRIKNRGTEIRFLAI